MWIERLHAWIEQGLPCVLVTVTDAAGSTPRPTGAKLVVNLEGAVAGSVGGGFIEHRCLEEARRVLATGTPACSTSGWTRPTGRSPWRRKAARSGAWRSSWSRSSRPGRWWRSVAGTSRSAWPASARWSGCPSGSTTSAPSSPAGSASPGPGRWCARPTASWAGTSVCRRPATAWWRTHGHAQDERVLEQLLQLPFLPYLGLVGSARKLQGIRERLAAKGLVLGSQVHSPAGLALGGSLPGDIALAILAEIKLQMDGGRLEHLGRADLSLAAELSSSSGVPIVRAEAPWNRGERGHARAPTAPRGAGRASSPRPRRGSGARPPRPWGRPRPCASSGC